jgi:hypothetical protein
MDVLHFSYERFTEGSMTVSRFAPIALVALSHPALAEGPVSDIWCAERDRVARILVVQQGAELRGQGIRDPESVMELWADKAGAWTLVVSYADGRSCVVAVGNAWDTVTKAPS